jgi:hypothetical protein
VGRRGRKEKEKEKSRRTSLRIPQLHLPIKRRRQELATVVVERDVVDGFRVAHEGAETLAFAVDVPELFCEGDEE